MAEDAEITVDPRSLSISRPGLADLAYTRSKFTNHARVKAIGFASGVWLLWNSSVIDITIVKLGAHFIHASFPSNSTTYHLLVGTGLYKGNFNCITHSSERSGGSGGLHSDSLDFLLLINRLGLLDVGYVGADFTWSRGSEASRMVSKRLYRVLTNIEGGNLWPEAKVRHLAKFSSDHCQLLLEIDMRMDRNRRPFRFEAAWLKHFNFNDFVQSKWRSFLNTPRALHFLKRGLKWHIFGNIQDIKQNLITKLTNIQVSLGAHPSDSLLAREGALNDELGKVLENRIVGLEHDLWRWIEDKQHLEELDVSSCHSLYTDTGEATGVLDNHGFPDLPLETKANLIILSPQLRYGLRSKE
ncbi:LOW QUALITY PROTEIN: hypothetical protein V2J09_009806 [Rumex salicifolius]